METLKRTVIALAAIFTFVGLFIVIFCIMPKATPENLIKVSGTVERIYEAGVKDVVFKLKEKNRTYYINRGLENGLTMDSVKFYTLNKAVDLYVVKMRFGLMRASHINKVVVGDKVLYGE